MIVHKYIPGLSIQKSGLGVSFSNVSESKIKVSVASGALTKNAVQYILSELKELELDVVASVDNLFYIMLCQGIAAPHTVDICVVQSSSLTRKFPVLAEQGYELIEVLGVGTINAGNPLADAVNCTVNEWV